MRSVKWLSNALNGGVTEDKYNRIKGNIQRANGKMLQLFSCMAFVFMGVMFAVSFVYAPLSGERYIYLLSAVSMAGVMAATFFSVRENLNMVTVFVHVFMILLLGSGILIGTLGSPNEISVTFIVLLVVLPQIVIDKPYRIMITSLVMMVTFVAADFYIKDGGIVITDIVNVIVFGMVILISMPYIIGGKIKRYALDDDNKVLSETDLLTGLRNRNSYEQMVRRLTDEKCRKLACVYVDVNGLHEMNNVYGHAAGDQMLRFVANEMRELYGENCTYRIGGDEFVAIVKNVGGLFIEDGIRQLHRNVENEGYHAASGYDIQVDPEINVELLVKSAEANMYRAKAEYYSRQDNDRRSRRQHLHIVS